MGVLSIRTLSHVTGCNWCTNPLPRHKMLYQKNKLNSFIALSRIHCRNMQRMKYVCDFKRRNWNQGPTTSQQCKLFSSSLDFHVLSCLSHLDHKLSGGGEGCPLLDSISQWCAFLLVLLLQINIYCHRKEFIFIKKKWRGNLEGLIPSLLRKGG